MTFNSLSCPATLNDNSYVQASLQPGNPENTFIEIFPSGNLTIDTDKFPENDVFEKRYVHKNGSLVWVQNSISLVKTNSVETDFLILHCQDITQRRKDEESIHKLYQSVEQSPAMVLITDLKGIIDYVNPKFEQVTGWKLSELTEKTPNILKSGKQDPIFYNHLWETLRRGEIWKGELLNQKKNGEEYAQSR